LPTPPQPAARGRGRVRLPPVPLSAGLALTGIRDQKGQSSRFEFESNMLAEFFERPTLANSRYPETVWIFLNEPVPTLHTGLTRKEELLQTWVQVKRID